jgi:hypothetical protein
MSSIRERRPQTSDVRASISLCSSMHCMAGVARQRRMVPTRAQFDSESEAHPTTRAGNFCP